MISYHDSFKLVINSPLDAKVCNYFREGAEMKIESIAQYLSRMEIIYRTPGVLVTILLPKNGYTPPLDGSGYINYGVNDFPLIIQNFEIKYYTFVEGIANENFVEVVFGYTYVAYASDNIGTNFSLVPIESSTHIAVLVSDYEVEPLTAENFTGLWFNAGAYQQVQSNWEEEDTNSPSYIQNKPTQEQSDWTQLDNTQVDFIKNKPEIKQSDWTQTDSTKIDFIRNKPQITTLYPGAPYNSIQYNKNNSFGGSSSFVFLRDYDSVYLLPEKTDSSKFFLSGEIEGPRLSSNSDGSIFEIRNKVTPSNLLFLNAGRFSFGKNTPDSETFVQIQEENIGNIYPYTLKVRDNNAALILGIKNSGEFYLPKITNQSQTYLLNYDSATGKVTYAAKEDSTVLIADDNSGMSVNGGNTASGTVELDQNDSKLPIATIDLPDSIGFYDSSVGSQARTTLANFPGWNLYVNGVFKTEIQVKDNLNFVEGNNVNLYYDTQTNQFTLEADGQSVDLLVDGVLRAEDITNLDIVGGTGINVQYVADNRVVINASPLTIPYTHIPDAFIAYNRNLYSYDISEGTALKLLNAPESDWQRDTSFGANEYIYTCSGTTIYRYDIPNDITISVNAGESVITDLVLASDGLYAISSGRCYYVSEDLATVIDYGSTLTTGTVSGLKTIIDGVTAKEYITFIDRDADRWHYKEVRSTYTGNDTDNWIRTCQSIGDFYASNSLVNLSVPGVFDVDNVLYNYGDFHNMINGDCEKFGYYAYQVPSGHIFSTQDEDNISTLKVTRPSPMSSTPTSYSITRIEGYNGGGDMGIYVAKNNNIFGQSYPYEQAVSAYVEDIHADYISGGFFEFTVNVLVGGGRPIPGTNAFVAQTHFHASGEDPKQFMSKDVFEVDFTLTHATEVRHLVTFVYFDAEHTANNIPPKDIIISGGIDLWVDDVLKEYGITKLNIASGTNVNLVYAPDGRVEINAESEPIDLYVNGSLEESGINSLKFVEGTKITITYNVNGELVFNVQAPDVPLTEMSVVGDGTALSKIKLVNDSPAPGNSVYYGTNAVGTKGFYPVPEQTVASELSIIGDGSDVSKLRLVNDAATPGNKKYYGTDASGQKGFHNIDVTTIESQYSVQGDGSTGNKIQLSGDAASPGIDKYYGTNAGGVKGFHTIPGTTPLAFTDLTDVIPENYIGKDLHVPIVIEGLNSLDLIDTEILETELAKFILLADCPPSYGGYANYFVKVNSTADGLIFSASGAEGMGEIVGVPIGGTTGYVLGKASNTDYDVAWIDPTMLNETDPIVGAISGIVKANGSGTISAAIANVDYSAPGHSHAEFHSPVTVADSTSINLTLSGQQITADAIFGDTVGTVCEGNDPRLASIGLSDDSVTYVKVGPEFKTSQAMTTDDIDWSSAAVFTKTITGTTTFTFSNPQINKVISMIIDGNFAITMPAGCSRLSGTYNGAVLNYIQIHCTNTSPATYWYSINQAL